MSMTRSLGRDAPPAWRNSGPAGLWGAAAGGLALAWRGAHLWHWAVFALLVALVPAVEALNTAIEILTDHISPGWSQTAKTQRIWAGWQWR